MKNQLNKERIMQNVDLRRAQIVRQLPVLKTLDDCYIIVELAGDDMGTPRALSDPFRLKLAAKLFREEIVAARLEERADKDAYFSGYCHFYDKMARIETWLRKKGHLNKRAMAKELMRERPWECPNREFLDPNVPF